MNTWLWWQSQLEIGPVKHLNKSILKLLCGTYLSDDQSLTLIEILRGI